MTYYRVIFDDGDEAFAEEDRRLDVIDRYNGFWRATPAELADRLLAGAVLFAGTDGLEERFIIEGAACAGRDAVVSAEFAYTDLLRAYSPAVRQKVAKFGKFARLVGLELEPFQKLIGLGAEQQELVTEGA